MNTAYAPEVTIAVRLVLGKYVSNNSESNEFCLLCCLIQFLRSRSEVIQPVLPIVDTLTKRAFSDSRTQL